MSPRSKVPAFSRRLSSNGSAAAPWRVDGLSGATLTSRGVTNLLRYWAGPYGYGPYLDRLSREASGDD